jgi:hypothetical protein
VRLLREKAEAADALEALKNHIAKPVADPQCVIDILTNTAKEAGVKIAEAIEYLEEFL